MKNLKQLLVLSLIVVLFISSSCTRDESSYPYYEFNDADKTLIIKYDYKPEQKIIYKNQLGEEVYFKVISNEFKRRGYYSKGTFSGGGGDLINYYDSKIIRMEILENQNSEEDELVNYIFSKNSNNFNNGINLPMWNVSSSAFIDEIQNPVNIIMRDFNNHNKIQMTIGDKLFEKVVIIESGSNEEYLPSINRIIPKKVNKVFYDYDFGIIRFDDIDGNQWKVIYPE